MTPKSSGKAPSWVCSVITTPPVRSGRRASLTFDHCSTRNVYPRGPEATRPEPTCATLRGEQRKEVVDPLYTERQTMDLLRIIIAILLPPLGVFLQVGIGKHFWINIVLTILGYIPGRSEEHTSELQSHSDLVCRLL